MVNYPHKSKIYQKVITIKQVQKKNIENAATFSMGMEMAIKPSSSFASLGAFPVCVIGCCVRVGIRSPHGTLVKNIK